MSDTEQYNGWTNRETWAVALHINNDQGWQESVREALREMDSRGPGGPTAPEEIDRDYAYRAGEIISDNVEETLFGHEWGTMASTGIIRDIGSLWRVNWTELGAAFLADLAEQDS